MTQKNEEFWKATGKSGHYNLVALHFKYDQARSRFVEWAQKEIAVVTDFHKRILFSDEAHFWLNGYVNKQNYRIWSEANPQVYVETPLHPEKLTLWCALWAGGIIGPYFFKNDEGHNITVNGDRYRAMITNFFIPEMNNHDIQELWFQQDGARCHTARATIDLLKDTFGDLLISRFGPVNWPPRSCDLTPLDYFLWGYVKSLVYADKPQTLDHLEDNIHRVIVDTRPQMLEKVIENWTSRLDYIRASCHSYMPEILFQIRFLTIVKGAGGSASTKTKLDKERTKLCQRELDHIATISRTMKPLVTKNTIKEKLRTAQGFLKKIRDLTEDPQHVLPDVFIWMISGGKRVAYQRLTARELMFSIVEEESGKTVAKFKHSF
ncbi:otoferlin [Trichonephila clavipes]|nr:otoferlin [Trichonephila clavipes]